MIVGVLFLLVAAGVGYYWRAQAAELGALRTEINDLKRKLGPLQKQVEKVKEFETQKAELVAKLTVITKLEQSRSGPAAMLQHLRRYLPEQLWLTQLSERSELAVGGVLVEGYAFANTDVARFMKNLEASKFFAIIQLIESQEAELEGIKVLKFRLRLFREAPPAPAVPAPPAAPAGPKVEKARPKKA